MLFVSSGVVGFNRDFVWRGVRGGFVRCVFGGGNVEVLRCIRMIVVDIKSLLECLDLFIF